MKKLALTCFALTLAFGGVRAPSSEAKTGAAPLVARMTFANGQARTVTLEGVGCSEALCSRVAVKTRAEGDSRVTRTWLDTIAAIRDITSQTALFVLKDGTARRLSVVHDNQFLYFEGQDGTEGKINLAGVTLVEFLAPGR